MPDSAGGTSVRGTRKQDIHDLSTKLVHETMCLRAGVCSTTRTGAAIPDKLLLRPCALLTGGARLQQGNYGPVEVALPSGLCLIDQQAWPEFQES